MMANSKQIAGLAGPAMNAMLKLALKILAALLMLLVLFSVTMYVATSPKFTVPATVKGDASLPAIKINGVGS